MSLLPVVSGRNDRVLVVSANPGVRRHFIDVHCGGETGEALAGADALRKLETGSWRVVLLERQLPDLHSEELAGIVRRRFPNVQVLFWDAPAAHLGEPHENCRRISHRAAPYDHHEESERGPKPALVQALPGMIGQSEAMQPVYRLARLVAPRTTTVLITGETGTGKELVARAIHQLSPRALRPFIVVNCAAIPDSLLESELFGHTRGAFTGAVQSQLGRFQAAQGGTLFLDEVAELPLSLQPKLLRFLEEKEVQRLGSPEVIHVDTRVVAATNADLTDYLAAHRLRRDLFYRISGFRIDLPPLRSRGGDILRLARHFLLRLAQSTRSRTLDVNPAAVQRLEAHGWEGNVRELQLVLEQASILAGDSAQIQPEHIRFALAAREQSPAEAA